MQISQDPFSFIEDMPTKNDDVYTALRYAIVNLYLAPGLIFSIQDLCEKLKMGRSPVRDALLRLEQDGLVEMLPQRGVRIALIDSSRVLQERFLRYAVEKDIMARFMEEHTGKDILCLQELINKQKEMMDSEKIDPRQFLNFDDEFHQFFYQAIHMDFCLKVVYSSTGDYRRVRLLNIITGEEDKNIIRQHEDILASILRKDMPKMEELFFAHISRVELDLDLLKERYGDLFVKNQEEKINPLAGNDFLADLL